LQAGIAGASIQINWAADCLNAEVDLRAAKAKQKVPCKKNRIAREFVGFFHFI
jgi:hypothetical protein